MESEKEKEWNRASLVAHHLTPTVDAMRTDLLTEADAERLEKQGFRVKFSSSRTFITDPDDPRYRNWIVGSCLIDAALIGVLTEMCREKGIGVHFETRKLEKSDGTASAFVLGNLFLYRDATPREIMNALLDALEASND